jgi:hypothetical protein
MSMTDRVMGLHPGELESVSAPGATYASAQPVTDGLLVSLTIRSQKRTGLFVSDHNRKRDRF